jgi:tripartite-type tricarboxylate transporter receptor subunit TctC
MGIKLRYAHYRGSPPAMNDVMAGNTQMMFADPVTGGQLAKAGKVRALAVTSKHRISVFPEIPTIEESGVPGYEATNWHMLLAPANTPGPIVAKLNAAINEGLRSAEMRESFAKLGLEPKTGTPGDFAAALADDAHEWESIVKESGIRLE